MKVMELITKIRISISMEEMLKLLQHYLMMLMRMISGIKAQRMVLMITTE